MSGKAARSPASGLLILAVATLAIFGQADLQAPPRYDGAGYVVLARSLISGQGYRAVDHPDQPRHAHFPPAYPAFIAGLSVIAGDSPLALHLASVACTVAATLAAWCWFRKIYPGEVALLLGLALAANWNWTRTGSRIQSEPLYFLLGQAGLLCAAGASRSSGALRGVALGLLLAGCLLTRHVAVALVVALLADLIARGCLRTAMTAALVGATLSLPWLGWMVLAAAERPSQLGLLAGAGPALGDRLAAQTWFYLLRIPDQFVGPVIETATVFLDRRWAAALATAGAVVASSVVVAGWVRALNRRRARLGGLVPLLTLPVLIVWPFTEAGRFLVPLVPMLIVGAYEGGVGLWRGVGRWIQGGSRRLSGRGIALLILAAAVPYTAASVVTGRPRSTPPAERAFEEACAWIRDRGDRPGPVLTRHPGEVFLRTGRHALEVSTTPQLGEEAAAVEAIAKLIERYQVAYLLIDDQRYAQAPPSPLKRFVVDRPGRVRRVWPGGAEATAAVVYEVVRAASEPEAALLRTGVGLTSVPVPPWLGGPQNGGCRSLRSGGSSVASRAPSS